MCVCVLHLKLAQCYMSIIYQQNLGGEGLSNGQINQNFLGGTGFDSENVNLLSLFILGTRILKAIVKITMVMGEVNLELRILESQSCYLFSSFLEV